MSCSFSPKYRKERYQQAAIDGMKKEQVNRKRKGDTLKLDNLGPKGLDGSFRNSC
jgi:hypothetical protein